MNPVHMRHDTARQPEQFEANIVPHEYWNPLAPSCSHPPHEEIHHQRMCVYYERKPLLSSIFLLACLGVSSVKLARNHVAPLLAQSSRLGLEIFVHNALHQQPHVHVQLK